MGLSATTVCGCDGKIQPWSSIFFLWEGGTSQTTSNKNVFLSSEKNMLQKNSLSFSDPKKKTVQIQKEEKERAPKSCFFLFERYGVKTQKDEQRKKKTKQKKKKLTGGGHKKKKNWRGEKRGKKLFSHAKAPDEVKQTTQHPLWGDFFHISPVCSKGPFTNSVTVTIQFFDLSSVSF